MTVDARAASAGRRRRWEHAGDELIVHAGDPDRRGRPFTVAVTYHGRPGDGATPTWGVPVGWIRTDGGSYTINEPDGAHSWFPSNDHPSDKATFTFHVTVPTGTVAVANGAPRVADHDRRYAPRGRGRRPSRWRRTWPSWPSATTASRRSTGPHGVVHPPRLPARRAATVAEPCLALDDADDRVIRAQFGPYPFDTFGLLVADSPPGLAMETQTRPIFSAADFSAAAPT